ncbi:YncE family protein [Paenibacillus crassostreae]|uniref:Cell surface protein n=1 Tax=Paenibacillus crassostreae TaxID=1763538 RepID=A0A167FGS9_9BACL|nr:YncE family protein [Paenibacillus crassostreae]AOZ94420.1 hypothetical protein LPB68_20905 [Paenibacillus crassostreae]OAB76544.1 hypothetical protein PNBC_03835 [Paenibacillus crassostreae]
MAQLKLITRIRLTEEIGTIKLNPITNMVYFTNQDAGVGTVGVLDANRNRIIARVKVGRMPTDLEINPRTNRIYISNFRDGTVSVISGRTNRVIKTVKVGYRPDTMGINIRKNRIYVTRASGRLSVLEGKTNRVRNTIQIGGRPSEIAINEKTNRIYVTNTVKNSVSTINGNTQAVITSIKVGKNPVIPPALNIITNRIYVANNLSQFLSVINGRTNKLMQNIHLGHLQSDIVANPRMNQIYVSSAQVEGPGKLFIINGHTNKIVTTMTLPTFSNLFVNPITNHLIISDFDKNRLIVYNASSLKRIAVFPTVAGNITLNPVTNKLYVGGNRSITVIQDAI